MVLIKSDDNLVTVDQIEYVKFEYLLRVVFLMMLFMMVFLVVMMMRCVDLKSLPKISWRVNRRDCLLRLRCLYRKYYCRILFKAVYFNLFVSFDDRLFMT